MILHILFTLFQSGYNYPFNGNTDSNALYLHNPPNISDSIIYDPETNSYIFTNTVGGHDITPPNYYVVSRIIRIMTLTNQ